jgi:isopentenyl phosphate kinase
VVQNCSDQDEVGKFVVRNQLQEISSLELVTSPRKDVTGGIQPKFVYHSTSLDYYELMEP